jgi:hypothetical protein
MPTDCAVKHDSTIDSELLGFGPTVAKVADEV